ncbi:MAG: polyphosphate polymerase domain-containing protein [Acetatifactor sp.]|nr:polyphosphate polymerase domain-containing protein [Acetatifactor sp.]
MAEKNYRQEIKRLLSPAQRLLLEQRIRAVMPRDSHGGDDGSYTIRSIYFDTVTDRFYREKESGISHREKIRIRFYDWQHGLIRLERKEKRGNLIYKDSMTISKETADAMMRNDYSPLPDYCNPLGDQIYGLAHSDGLHPVVVVDYVRTAYVFPVGHVRITFDSLLQAGRPGIPVWAPDEGECYDVMGDDTILEIKFNQYLPDHIRQLLSSVSAPQMALSKYVLCRNALMWKQGDFTGGKVRE